MVPRCSILGANLMATLSEKKEAKKQRTQRHILQDSQFSKAQTGSAALEEVNRDPSLTALRIRLEKIQILMRRLKTTAFWPLVLDPRSFSATVENMFAVAMAMDLGLLQLVEHEGTHVAMLEWDFNEDEKQGNVNEDTLMARIGDQGLNDEEAAQEQEQAAGELLCLDVTVYCVCCTSLTHCCSATGTAHFNQLHLHHFEAVAGTLRRFGDRARSCSVIQRLIAQFRPKHEARNSLLHSRTRE